MYKIEFYFMPLLQEVLILGQKTLDYILVMLWIQAELWVWSSK